MGGAHRHGEEAAGGDKHDAMLARWHMDDLDAAVQSHKVDDERRTHAPEAHPARLAAARVAKAVENALGDAATLSGGQSGTGSDTSSST